MHGKHSATELYILRNSIFAKQKYFCLPTHLVWVSTEIFFVVCLHIWYDSTDFFSVCLHIWYTVNSGIEARLLFNFWTFVAVFYLSFCQFLCNKSPNFHDFSSLLFETVFYSKQSSIPEFTVSKDLWMLQRRVTV